VSSGLRTIHRLSRRDNRRLSHAIRMAAVTQIRQRHSHGRAYFDKKLAEGSAERDGGGHPGPHVHAGDSLSTADV
jgi:hypothetical protein